MDLNYLYHRRGKSLLMAAAAACRESREAHLALAHGYVQRIAEFRRARMGSAAAAVG